MSARMLVAAAVAAVSVASCSAQPPAPSAPAGERVSSCPDGRAVYQDPRNPDLFRAEGGDWTPVYHEVRLFIGSLCGDEGWTPPRLEVARCADGRAVLYLGGYRYTIGGTPVDLNPRRIAAACQETVIQLGETRTESSQSA